MKKLSRFLGIVLSFMMLPYGPATALPSVDSASADVSVVADASGMTITTGDKAIINYSSFDIGSSETVSFVQPSATSVALNRVTGSSASSINGSLLANGRIFLVNPNGVFIGGSGIVNAAGFVASSLAISDSDFLSGNYSFTGGSTAGGVRNDGHINVGQGGYVGLIGRQVVNNGQIDCGYGRVALVAGDTVSVDFEGDGLMSFAVDGKLADSLVKNAGSIHAGGGDILIAVSAAADIAGGVVNNTGVIEAMSVEGAAGTIRLVAPGAGIRNEGEITTAGRNGAQGGTIAIVADLVSNEGTINVAGDTGALGGTVTLTAGTVEGAGEVIAEEVVEGEAPATGEENPASEEDVAAEATGTVVNVGTIDATAGAVDIDSTGDVVNEGVINVEDGLLDIDAGGEITNTGDINAEGGAVELDADGVVTTSGSLVAETVEEYGAGFEVSGKFVVGSAYMENADGAATFGSGAYSGYLSDPGNIIFTAGADITLLGNLVIMADNDVDGVGYIQMGTGAYIVGGGFNLNLFASEASTLGAMSGLGNINFNKSKIESDFVYTMAGNIAAATLKNEWSTKVDVGANTLSTTGLFDNHGTINFATGGTLTSTGGLTNTDAGSIIGTGSGTINVSGGELWNTSGSIINIDAGYLNVDNILRNNYGGQITSNTGNIDVDGGNILNTMGGTINNNGGQITTDMSFFNSDGGIFHNSGDAIFGAKLYDEVGSVITNTGNGSIYATGAFYLNSGSSFTHSSTGTVSIGGSMSMLEGATLTVDGGGTFNIDGVLGTQFTAGDIVVDGSTFTVGGNFYNNTNFYISNGSTVSGGAAFVNGKLFDIDASSFSVTGNAINTIATLNNKNGSTMNIGGYLFNTNGGSIVENDASAITVGISLYNSEAGEILNKGAGTIDIGVSIGNDIGGLVHNEDGIITVTNSVNNAFGATIQNDTGTINITNHLYNSNGGIVKNTDSGLISVGDRLYNEIGGTVSNLLTGQISVGGKFYNNGGSVVENLGTGTLTCGGSFNSVEGATLVIAPGASFDITNNLASADTSGNFDIDGNVYVGGNYSSNGTLNIGVTGQITVMGFMNSIKELFNNGYLEVRGNFNNVSGLVNNNDGHMNVGGTFYNTNGSGTITNGTGLLEVAGTLWNNVSGIITNALGGIIDVAGSLGNAGGSSLTNAGTVYIGNNVLNNDGSTIANTGTIEITNNFYNATGGIFDVSGAGSVATIGGKLETKEGGVVDIYNDARLDVAGNVDIIEFNGSFGIDMATLTVGGNFTNAHEVTIEHGSLLDIEGDIVVGYFESIFNITPVSINVGGNWGGVTYFDAGQSTVTFGGTGVSTVDTGWFAFYNMVLEANKQMDIQQSLRALNNIDLLADSLINMTGYLEITSDQDGDGSGLITMAAGATIDGNGNDLTISTKRASALGTIVNVPNYILSYQD